MVLLIGNTKGGVGKSTTAWHLAIWLQQIQGHDTLLIDADDSASTGANLFTAHRDNVLKGNIGYSMIRLTGKDLFRTVKDLRKKYKYIIIDTGATDTESLRTGLVIADLFILPCQPKALDAWITQMMFPELIKRANANRDNDLPIISFLSRAQINGSHNRATFKVLQELDNVTVLDNKILNRVCFEEAFKQGLSIFEYENELDTALPTARQELNNLFQTILNKLYEQSNTGATYNAK